MAFIAAPPAQGLATWGCVPSSFFSLLPSEMGAWTKLVPEEPGRSHLLWSSRCFKGKWLDHRPEPRVGVSLLSSLKSPVNGDITPQGLTRSEEGGSLTGATWPCLRQGQTMTDVPPYFRGMRGLSPEGLASPEAPNQLGSSRAARTEQRPRPACLLAKITGGDSAKQASQHVLQFDFPGWAESARELSKSF